jgi:CheY-like chemotaxis protein
VEATAAAGNFFDAKVLIAEDNIINQKLILHILQEFGLRVDLANNGLEAFEKRRNNTYDLIFMDIQMPVMDGIEATHEILDYEEDEEVSHIPIIALTANALKGDKERFLSEGLDEYISKPLETSELLVVLNKYLADKTISKAAVPSETAKTEAAEEKPSVLSKKKDEDTTEDTIDFIDTIELNKEDEKPANKILIVKKSLLEGRILAKMIDNLDQDYTILEALPNLETEAKSGNYDILIADADLLPDDLSQIEDSLAIIALSDQDKDQAAFSSMRGEIAPHTLSKETLETLIKKYRG